MVLLLVVGALMRYAVVRRDAVGVLKKGRLIWLPMLSIKYSVRNKTFEKMFDAVLYRRVSATALPLLIRNPKDYTWSDKPDVEGVVIQPAVTDPQELLNDIALLYDHLTRAREGIHDRVSRSPVTQMAGLIIPAIYYLSMKPVDRLWFVENALEILEMIGFGKDRRPQALSGELVYVPVVLADDLSEAYEPALKKERSESLTWLLQDRRFREFFRRVLGLT